MLTWSTYVLRLLAILKGEEILRISPEITVAFPRPPFERAVVSETPVAPLHWAALNNLACVPRVKGAVLSTNNQPLVVLPCPSAHPTFASTRLRRQRVTSSGHVDTAMLHLHKTGY